MLTYTTAAHSVCSALLDIILSSLQIIMILYYFNYYYITTIGLICSYLYYDIVIILTLLWLLFVVIIRILVLLLISLINYIDHVHSIGVQAGTFMQQVVGHLLYETPGSVLSILLKPKSIPLWATAESRARILLYTSQMAPHSLHSALLLTRALYSPWSQLVQ